jgi:hypothetical protein
VPTSKKLPTEVELLTVPQSVNAICLDCKTLLLTSSDWCRNCNGYHVRWIQNGEKLKDILKNAK